MVRETRASELGHSDKFSDIFINDTFRQLIVSMPKRWNQLAFTYSMDFYEKLSFIGSAVDEPKTPFVRF